MRESTMDTFCPPALGTRAAGLARLTRFVPHAGSAYAAGRNLDTGPGAGAHVSGLAPYVHRRLVTEAELIEAAVSAHGDAAEKFVAEVLWRTYWRGWLEHHPAVWRGYRERRRAAREARGGMARAIERASAGESGHDVVDRWARELVERGYLHNHARMWFASAWIFTLGLPWAAGADFFHRTLHDGDPASNLLGWRWVAGLQTRGKHYLARADNIVRWTGGRVRPEAALAESAPPLPDDGLQDEVHAPGLPTVAGAAPPGRLGLLLTGEDLSLEHSELKAWPVVAVAGLPSDWLEGGDALLASPHRRAFDRVALDDALERAGRHWRVPSTCLPSPQAPRPGALVDALAAWCHDHRLDVVLTPWPRVGPWGDLLAAWRRDAARLQDVPVRTFLRRHDAALYPLATRGFFHFKKRGMWSAARRPHDPRV